MKKTKKMILESRFQKAMQMGMEYIAVAVSFADQENFEIIVNENKNFESKLRYYQSSYNDDLTLKTCEDISIISVVSFDGDKTASEIRNLLEDFEI